MRKSIEYLLLANGNTIEAARLKGKSLSKPERSIILRVRRQAEELGMTPECINALEMEGERGRKGITPEPAQAKFIGAQDLSFHGMAMRMYNIEGDHELNGSTVSVTTLVHQGVLPTDLNFFQLAYEYVKEGIFFLVCAFEKALCAAKAFIGLSLMTLICVAAPARAWEFARNPDRFPSVGLRVDNLSLDGDRLETVFNSAGQEVPYRNSVDTETEWKGGVDVRLPCTDNLTLTAGYDLVERDQWFSRRNTLGGDMYKEHRAMKGYSYSVGMRLYFSK